MMAQGTHAIDQLGIKKLGDSIPRWESHPNP
jgi:hypothetical protein